MIQYTQKNCRAHHYSLVQFPPPPPKKKKTHGNHPPPLEDHSDGTELCETRCRPVDTRTMNWQASPSAVTARWRRSQELNKRSLLEPYDSASGPKATSGVCDWGTHKPLDMSAFSWTVVVLTCQHKDSVYAFHRELELRQRGGSVCAGAMLLTVQDRQEPLGSGGATLNALLVAAEHLSARAGHTVVTADVLDEAHILILHTGRDFPWSSCSRAFSWLPAENPATALGVEAPVCCVDVLIRCLTQQVCPGSPPGVWVCSTDMMFSIPENFALSWDGFSGVRAVALPGDVSYAADHGVYLSDRTGHIKDIIYKGSREQVQQALMHDGKVPLVSGPVFFSRSAAEKLLQTHVTPPLDGCTYLGLDSGAPPLRLSLFLDVLKCLCCDQSEDEPSGADAPASGPQGATLRRGRKELRRILRGTPLTLAYVPGGRYDYMTLSGRRHVLRLTSDPTQGHALSHIQVAGAVSGGGRVINSVLEGMVTVATGAVVQHCHLQGPLRVPSGCLLSGLDASTSPDVRRLALGDDVIIQGHRVELGDLKLKVYTTMGGLDDLELRCDDEGASFLNAPWRVVFSRTGIQPQDLWAEGEGRSLLEARLFPALPPREGGVGVAGGVAWLLGGAGCVRRWREAWRLSLKEVLALTHQEEELRWRETLLFLAGRKRTRDALTGRSDVCVMPSFRAAVAAGQQGALLELLDTIAAGSGAEQGEEPQCKQSHDDGDVHVAVSEGAQPGVTARCLSCIADVLTCWAEAEGGGGLRSGPSANEKWSATYFLLEKGDVKGGVKALAEQRANWLSRPDLLVRAARHYEGAAQVLLRRAVMSSQKFVDIGQGVLPPLEQWHEVECPARIDLAGGWSDTPPLAFEHGGCVTNVAVKIDGRRPIGARARRIKEPRLLLVSHSGGRDSGIATETVCETMDHLKDYCQPNAPGALLKAVCVCADVVSPSSRDPLGRQLTACWSGGLELHGWSALPTGSGLGTSSILAGALLAAVYAATGRSYTGDALIHAVLHLEQVLTTGGGWQDQVGGLEGGLKVGRSQARLPLRVHVERLRPPDGFVEALEQRLLLVYTGKTRLARNLLQDVVRSWYSRLPAMVRNLQELVSNSEDCARACLDGCLSSLGRCLDRSWRHKKRMAPGCEPASVRVMMEALRPLVLGQSLAGAGGGGFLCLLTRRPAQKDAVLRVLARTPGLGDFSVHTVQLDMDGLTVLQPV
ncbi:L-fucose kinase isoform X2 [Phycodurus eques]|uniref:L-fucose kinase isoform X2 n=1 Tax=Phycodurus eques TaxID=693459 RepID=UPI002ACEA8B0|nr:L-fucose kinase isoform X2 [Phycodurus eques]